MKRLYSTLFPLLLAFILAACSGGSLNPGESSCTANPPPQIIGTPSTSANVGAQYRYDYTAKYNCLLMTCYDADPILMPPGATMDHVYDIIYWTPGTSDVNKDFQFTIATPRDPCGNSATQSWVVHVYPEYIPPTVGSTLPAANATNISPYAPISVTFSEAVDPQTVGASSFLVSGQSGAVNGTVTVNGATATFTPAARLSYQSNYTATITTSVKDLAGNALASNYMWSFSTASLAATSTSPFAGDTYVPANTPIIATFPEPINPLTVNAASLQVTGPSGAVPGTFSVNGATVTFTPDAYLSYGTQYSVTLGTTIQDTAGEALSASYTWFFTTGWTPDTTPPSTPTGLMTSTITFDSLPIMWNPSTDNSAIRGYNVYRDGIKILYETPVTSFYDVNFLTLDVPYCYTVSAVDMASNESGQSGYLCATPPNLPPGSIAQWGSICTGINPYGNCLFQAYNNPIQLPNLDSVTAISAYAHSLALKSDGTVWAWGLNSNGQLGDGTATSRSTPVQVSNFGNAIAISAGRQHSLALKSDGTVWAWGDNSNGQLGDGTTTSHSMPVQVSNLGNVTAISAGYAHSLALKSDGTIWIWGAVINSGTWANSPIPVQVSTPGNVIAISTADYYSLVLLQDGSVWRWGYDRTGNNTNLVQVGGLNGITAISAGAYALALKSDGTVWTWDGSAANSMAWQITGLSNISGISASHASGSANSLALRQDGTVWVWPWSWSGSETPVQVYKLQGISAVSAGWYSYFALR